MRMTLNIRQKHIEAARRQDSSRCVVAVAFKDVGVDVRCVVSELVCIYAPNGRHYHCITAGEVPSDHWKLRQFVVRFDDGVQVKPATFELEFEEYVGNARPAWPPPATKIPRDIAGAAQV